MSEQNNQSIFDRYSKRRSSHLPEQENRPSLVPLDDGLEDATTGQETAHSSDRPVLDVYSHEEDDEVVLGGVYKAAFIYKAKGRQRLRLHYANGVKVKVLSYSYLIEVVLTSHQWLTLVFSSTIVTLKGRNLDRLVEALQDERVRALVCYRPGIHPEVASHEPCILDIQERGVHEFAGEKKD